MSGTSDIRLEQAHFDELVARRGKLATWQMALQCSCWSVQNGGSGGPNYSCMACGGTGYIYQPPTQARILLQGIDTKRDFLPAGTWQTGDIIASIPYLQRIETPGPTGTLITWGSHPFWSAGTADLIFLTDSEFRRSQVLIRNQPLYRWPADTLAFPSSSIVQVTSLLVSNSTSGVVTTFIPGVLGTDYTLSNSVVTWQVGSIKDFMINGNKIVFNPNGTNAKNLADGTQYSVTYTHYPTYIVYIDLPEPRDQDGQHMPRKIVLRLKDVG